MVLGFADTVLRLRHQWKEELHQWDRRRLDGSNQLPKVITGVKFHDGLERHDEIEREAA